MSWGATVAFKRDKYHAGMKHSANFNQQHDLNIINKINVNFKAKLDF
jgi:hypothetical protein